MSKKEKVYIPYPEFPEGITKTEAFDELARLLLFKKGYERNDMILKYKNTGSPPIYTESEINEIILHELRMKYDKQYRKDRERIEKLCKLNSGIRLFKIFNFDIVLKRRK